VEPPVTTAGVEPALARVREHFAAFLSGDPEAYAAQWVYPACVHADGRWRALLNPAACRESNERYLRELRAQGMLGGRILELTARPEGRHAVWVDGRFSHEAAAGRVLAETRAAYLVVRVGEDWRVAVCVLKD
jgi:hypothetical protein